MHLRTLLRTGTAGVALAVVAGAAATVPAAAGPDDHTRAVVEHWTAERVAAAVPRALVVDAHGRGFLPGAAAGDLKPYGHDGPGAATPLRAVPTARPDAPGSHAPGNGQDRGGPPALDTTPPAVTDLDPDDTTITDPHTFSATVTDTSGIRSVEFLVAFPADSPPQSFHAVPDATGDRWAVTLEGFAGPAAPGQWWVVARDRARRGGNTATTGPVGFTVEAGDDGGIGPGGDVAHAAWTTGGAVQAATGRLLFELPDPDTSSGWQGYWCSGTVVADATAGRSVVLTAAHCVYDDLAKVFARHVLFVPDQAGTTGARSDRVCSNDPLGCWAPRFGVVDGDWASREFPDNIPWDHGWYAVPDTGAHSPGLQEVDDALDVAAGALPLASTTPAVGAFTHALGYSASHDPDLMYCAEALGTEADHGGLWLDACDLAGGASGGPWVQPMDLHRGSGPVVSINTWGWTGRPGMGGPRLATAEVACVFAVAADGEPTEDRGHVASEC